MDFGEDVVRGLAGGWGGAGHGRVGGGCGRGEGDLVGVRGGG